MLFWKLPVISHNLKRKNFVLSDAFTKSLFLFLNVFKKIILNGFFST